MSSSSDVGGCVVTTRILVVGLRAMGFKSWGLYYYFNSSRLKYCCGFLGTDFLGLAVFLVAIMFS
jgi:hypothetical protein